MRTLGLEDFEPSMDTDIVSLESRTVRLTETFPPLAERSARAPGA